MIMPEFINFYADFKQYSFRNGINHVLKIRIFLNVLWSFMFICGRLLNYKFNLHSSIYLYKHFTVFNTLYFKYVYSIN